MANVQTITGHERRRSWSEGQKHAIVAAAFAPGAIVADVGRRAEICAGQIYRGARRCAAPSAVSRKWCSLRSMTAAVIAPHGPAPAIEIEFADRARLRIAALTPSELAAAVVRALRR